MDSISSLPSLLALGSTSLPVEQKNKKTKAGAFSQIVYYYLLRCQISLISRKTLELNTEGDLTLLNDDGVQSQLHLGPLHNPLLHRVFSDETEDAHLLLLTNPVGSVLKCPKSKTGQVRAKVERHPCHHMLRTLLTMA